MIALRIHGRCYHYLRGWRLATGDTIEGQTKSAIDGSEPEREWSVMGVSYLVTVVRLRLSDDGPREKKEGLGPQDLRGHMEGMLRKRTCSRILQTLLPNPLSFTKRSNIASGVSGPLDEALLEANALPPANLNA